MQAVFEKIIEELEKLDVKAIKRYKGGTFGDYEGTDYYIKKSDAIEIVKQEAEQYNNGWISCIERLPDECVPVNVTWINRNPESYYAKIKDVPFSATAVYYNSKWYWYSSTCVDYLSEYGKNDFDLVDKDIDIIAWQPLPEPFKERD